MIKKYNSFREDSLLEGIINESMMYFSPKVRVMFNNIKDNQIAKELLDFNFFSKNSVNVSAL